MESENARLATSLKLLKEGSSDDIIEFLKKRTPKIVTDNTPKEALKKMVEDLECEIGENFCGDFEKKFFCFPFWS